MKVLFIQSVPPHHPGDLAEVSPGYAHNFLFPKKLAKAATSEAIAEARQHAAHLAKTSLASQNSLQSAMKALDGGKYTIPARASSSGTLYATLQAKHIAEVLSKESGHPFPIDLLTQLPSIKQAGEYSVTLQYRGQNATFTLKV